MEKGKKNVLIYCQPNDDKNKDCALGLQLIDMINQWSIEYNIECVTTLVSELPVGDFDKVVFVSATSDENIHEFKFIIKDEKYHEFYIRGFECVGGLSDNAKLNLEQAYQYITRKISDWVLVKKKLPIDMLNNC